MNTSSTYFWRLLSLARLSLLSSDSADSTEDTSVHKNYTMTDAVEFMKNKAGLGNSSVHYQKKVEEPVDISLSLRGIQYVIFPDSKFAQAWDFIVIFTIFYYSFSIPYQLGISAGYASLTNDAFFIVNLLLNVIFMIDTILQFFRAYRDKHGVLVYNLRKISRNYVTSGWLFINLMASFPSTGITRHILQDDGGIEQTESDSLNLLIFELFKLFRLVRIKKLLKSSVLISTVWERINVGYALTLKFLFMIIVVSHWVACIWGFIAFQEAGSLGKEELLQSLNWISNWYNGSYVEGGLDPTGWRNHVQRYMLCLFWAIQTITSIGYGNIAPVTTTEYSCANALMLFSGFFWAYIIGSLVDAVTAGSQVEREYINRMDNANEMVRDFTAGRLPDSVVGVTSAMKASKRVRRFITVQRDRATHKMLDSHSGQSLSETYPTLEILSPELKKVAALHLAHDYIETIPYLSSRYLSPDEQADIALKCITLEFATGEKFSEHHELGRGILIFQRGFGFATRNERGKSMWRKTHTNLPIDVNEVLVEDEYFAEFHLTYYFIGFSKALFIPRSAIMEILSKNKLAWTQCARWRYFLGALILHHLGNDPEQMSSP